MDKNDNEVIIAFPNETQALFLSNLLKKNSIKSKLISIPRDISAGCGMAVMVDKKDIDTCKTIINDNNVKINGIH